MTWETGIMFDYKYLSDRENSDSEMIEVLKNAHFFNLFDERYEDSGSILLYAYQSAKSDRIGYITDIVIACHQKEPIGIMIMESKTDPHVINIYVLPEFRRMGVGKGMVEECMKESGIEFSMMSGWRFCVETILWLYGY